MLVPIWVLRCQFLEAADRGSLWRYRTPEAIVHPVILNP
jgi:hypothetical protein